MSSSNCCFLTCIQISQEAGKVVWYSHLFKNVLQFTVIHTVKGFGIVNKAEIDVFLELSFSMIQRMLAIRSLVPLPFLKPAWTSGSSWFTYCWSVAWRILSVTLLACEMSANKISSIKYILKVIRLIMRNLYAGQEATVRTGHGTTDWFQRKRSTSRLYIVTLLI